MPIAAKTNSQVILFKYTYSYYLFICVFIYLPVSSLAVYLFVCLFISLCLFLVILYTYWFIYLPA